MSNVHGFLLCLAQGTSFFRVARGTDPIVAATASSQQPAQKNADFLYFQYIENFL
jgi:hypothetical protein